MSVALLPDALEYTLHMHRILVTTFPVTLGLTTQADLTVTGDVTATMNLDVDLKFGVRTDGTVMFCDLRGFTSLSEGLEPEQVVEVVNRYLSEMTEAILAHGGTLVSFMGDGIMALFGAPIEQSDHAGRAIDAAREMLSTRLPRFNAWLREYGIEHEFRMGIGLNSGPVMSGNVGSEQRLEYTALGDTTNTAARLEGMTKGTPYSVLIAESTVESLRNPPEDIVFYEEQSVRGRREKLKLYALDIKKPADAPDQPGVKAVGPAAPASAPEPGEPAPAPTAGA